MILVYELADEQAEGEVSSQDGIDGQTQDVDMDNLIAAIKRRVNPSGVKEITIREAGVGQIEIIVPEVDETEVERLKRIINDIGTLEFRIMANERDHGPQIQRAQRPENANKYKIYDDERNLVAWWVPVSKDREKNFDYPDVVKRAGRTEAGYQFTEVLMASDNWNVNGGFLKGARTGMDDTGGTLVNFTFNSRGGQLFAGLTGDNVPDKVTGFQRKLGIILSGYLYSAPNIKSTIHDRGSIEGDFSTQEADELVSVLNAGSLPAKLKAEPASQLATGPTLGKDTIRRGQNSIAASMVLVLIFMVFYYRFAGVVACFAMVANLVLILAIMITVNAAFTLPGLAGLVLTVGMAVDANVLIFERIREELNRQATLRMAIRNGFKRATTTIVDANLTTLITGVVLYTIGTDQVRGFAVTLILGVSLSMYTAIFCSRVIFDIAEKKRWLTQLKMLRIVGGTKIDFLGKRRVAAVVSIAVICLGLAAVVHRGKGLLDIDFTGGVSIQVMFDEPQNIADIRSQLKDLDDLAVSDVQIPGEPPNRRFVINTSSPPDMDAEKHLENVRKIIVEKYGRKLAHYSMSWTVDGDVESPQGQPAAPKTTSPAPEIPPQTRADLPPDSLLASADASAVLLAQAEPAKAETPKKDDGESKPAEADSKKAADPPAAPKKPDAAEKPDDPKAETPSDKPAAGPGCPGSRPGQTRHSPTRPARSRPALARRECPTVDGETGGPTGRQSRSTGRRESDVDRRVPVAGQTRFRVA